jgi:hypothetical protein
MYAVSIMWLNGVRTINVFKESVEAEKYANTVAAQYKGCRVFLGYEVIAQSPPIGSTEEE